MIPPPAGRHPDMTPPRAMEPGGLLKASGEPRAVAAIALAVPAGTVYGVLGPNGAGKTTTLRMLLGLTRPNRGSATIGGRAYAELADPLRDVGALIDPNCFHPGRSGRDALGAIARMGRIGTGRVDEVLELVDLTAAAGRRVGGYSLGMRQRLALAAALLGDPATLILDEPANGLDPLGVRWLRALIRMFTMLGLSVAIASSSVGRSCEGSVTK